MRRARSDGDFDVAFVALYPRAVQVGVRLLRDRAGAEDVAAEALARAYSKWSTVRGMDHRDAWVLRVTANLALDVLRRRPRGQRQTGAGEEETVLDRLALAQALRHLPPRQRDVVVLRYLVDLSEADVAEVLGLAPGTVKSHLHRAIAGLRRQMGVEIGEVTGAFI